MTRRHTIIAIALIAALFIGSTIAYFSFPERIPSHWNARGQIDGYGSKKTVLIMPFATAFILGLFAALPWMSPAHFKLDTFRETYGYIVLITVGLFIYLQLTTFIAVSRPGLNFTRVLLPGVFVYLALLGNVLGKVPRNFFVGVRVPWTLANERVWNETHRLAAWLFFGAGLLGALLAVIGLTITALVVLAPAIAIPIVFSFFRYKQLERRGEL